MKYAVIVVGSHFVGKSKTIVKYFKPLIGLSGRQRSFNHGRVLSQSLEEHQGHVLSQSLEEKGLQSVNDFIAKYSNYNYLVCAARPDGEIPSVQKLLESELKKRGFKVTIVVIEPNKDESFYRNKAKEIYSHLHITLVDRNTSNAC